MHACTHTRMHACTHTRTHAHTHTHAYTHTHTHALTQTQTHTHTHARTYARTFLSAMGLKKMLKRKDFKENLEGGGVGGAGADRGTRRTETGSGFQVETGAHLGKQR